MAQEQGFASDNLCVLIVVCKYNENISWLRGECVVYDKRVTGNVGRESESFVRYILEHYDRLPPRVIFLQGNPFDHCPDLWQRLENHRGGVEALSNMIVVDDINGCPNHCGLPIKAYIDKYAPEIKQDVFMFGAGAQYIVPRENILSKPVGFWSKIHKSHWEDQMAPWILERLWPTIWNMTI